MARDATVRAGCDVCAVTITVTVVDDTIPNEVAQFFREHIAHLAAPTG